MPCCDASKIFEGNVSTQDATVVRNLRGEGAILLGKTNIPEFAFHYDSNNLVYGATRNPHDPERSVGGSSGGEGAALATGITPIGVGLGLRRLDPRAGALQRRHRPEAGALGGALRRPLPARAGDVDPAVVGDRADGPLHRGPRAAAADLREARPDDRSRRGAAQRRSRTSRGAARRDLRRGRHVPGGPGDPRGRRATPAGRSRMRGHEVVEERPPNQAEVREVFESIALAETMSLLWPVIEPREDELSPQIRRLLARREERDSNLADLRRAGSPYRLDLERRRAPGSRPTTSPSARSRRPRRSRSAPRCSRSTGRSTRRSTCSRCRPT